MVKIQKIQLPKFSEELELLDFRVDIANNVLVKYYEEGIQAGFPSPALDYKEKRISLDSKYLSKPNSTFLIRAKGMSMAPTLQPNDLLVVYAHVELTDNKIGILSLNNSEFTVKRFDKTNNKLIADNPEFSNIPLEEDDTLSCLGVVAHLVREL
ncbi:SOS response UmuD protein [Balneicella halophila]|uniref:SOS response UmuD protein n=1 Tax=Balneicella halophila TaxID=1537566 RepID=A0A7L4USB1_BALHA|nr:S24 family peptidase [Balneicella halophila]PVX52301.1 SOS response UmuD protein [Balneicella halophila]